MNTLACPNCNAGSEIKVNYNYEKFEYEGAAGFTIS